MKPNSTLLIIGAFLLAGGIYWYFFMGTGEQSALTASSANGSGNLSQTKFQALVSELRPISFNSAIFVDPNFTALVDLTTPVTPETPGRLDPFAQLPGIAK